MSKEGISENTSPAHTVIMQATREEIIRWAMAEEELEREFVIELKRIFGGKRA